MVYLNKLADQLETHRARRHVFFLLLAIIATFVIGYHYGTFDQVVHIPYLKKTANPNLYPGDPFLSLRIGRPSFFWFPFVPLYRAGLLQLAMFLVHLLTVYGTLWMAWGISHHLFEQPLTSLIITVALVFPHAGFPNVQAIEFSLLNRTFALPFLLGSILLYLKHQKSWAYLLCGLMVNIHVIYAGFVFAMFFMDEILNHDWKRWWELPGNLLLFGMIASPVIIWRFQYGLGHHFALSPDILDLVSRGLLHTVFYPLGPFRYAVANFLVGLGTLWGFLLGYRATSRDSSHKVIRNLCLGLGLLMLIGLLASYLLPSILLLQFQFLRSGIFLLYFSIFYLGYFLKEQLSTGSINQTQFILLAICLITLGTPLAVIIFWYILRLMQAIKLKPAYGLSVLIATQLLLVYYALRWQLWSPGIHMDGPDSEWRQAQEWAKSNTPVEARFIAPPYFFGNFDTTWRVFSERASLVSIAEMMEILFNPGYLESFTSRFEALAPGAIEQFNGNLRESTRITKNAYYSHSSKEFIRLGCQFKADYLVVEQGYPQTFRLVYNNQEYLIYELPDCPPDELSITTELHLLY